MNIRRKSTLRESLSCIKFDRIQDEHVSRLRGRYLFRAAARLVLEYIEWIKGDSSIIDPVIGVDGDVLFMPRKKSTNEHYKLTLQDRAVLLIQPQSRSKKDKSYIAQLIKKLRAFKKYPDDLRDSIASICCYQYFGPGRVIVRQNHPAHCLYYIVDGHVELSKIEKDNITGETSKLEVGMLGRGDMFGEVALLHSISRSTTVKTETMVDFFYIKKSHFDRLLKSHLLKNWNVLQDALVTFNYFSTWDETTVRECCIISKIKDFQPNEIILGDGMGMVNYVHFVLSGNCRLIEHMLISAKQSCGRIKYKLYNADESSVSRQCSKRPSREVDDATSGKAIDIEPGTDSVAEEDFSEGLLTERNEGKIDIEQMSVVTTTLQDVVNQWHEITEVVEELMRRPSTFSQQTYPEYVQTVFMKICEFHRGACFGLGEEMRNRRIVSLTPVRCLLVPRYWLLEHNRANIWERVRVFINSKYPSRDKLFNQFVTNRRWMKYKKNLIHDIIERGKNITNNTTIHDVPYSIRINEQFQDYKAGNSFQYRTHPI